MNWKPPKSENAWEECLWAYLDGELSFAERRSLERHIERHPERAARLETLRRSSEVLREWTVEEAPAPDAAFLRELDRRQEIKRSRWFMGWLGRLPRLAPFAAIFLAGVAAGVFGAGWTRGVAESDYCESEENVSREFVMETSPISPAQAEALLEGMKAEALSAQSSRRRNLETRKLALAAEKERLKQEREKRRTRSSGDNEFRRRIIERYVRLAKM